MLQIIINKKCLILIYIIINIIYFLTFIGYYYKYFY